MKRIFILISIRDPLCKICLHDYENLRILEPQFFIQIFKRIIKNFHDYYHHNVGLCLQIIRAVWESIETFEYQLLFKRIYSSLKARSPKKSLFIFFIISIPQKVPKPRFSLLKHFVQSTRTTLTLLSQFPPRLMYLASLILRNVASYRQKKNAPQKNDETMRESWLFLRAKTFRGMRMGWNNNPWFLYCRSFLKTRVIVKKTCSAEIIRKRKRSWESLASQSSV